MRHVQLLASQGEMENSQVRNSLPSHCIDNGAEVVISENP